MKKLENILFRLWVISLLAWLVCFVLCLYCMIWGGNLILWNIRLLVVTLAMLVSILLLHYKRMRLVQQQILKEILSSRKYKVEKGRLYYFNALRNKWSHIKGFERLEGYIQIVLGYNGKHKVFLLHEVVWVAKIGFLPPDMGIYPKDGNWKNCAIGNLGLRRFKPKHKARNVVTEDMQNRIKELKAEGLNTTQISKYMGITRQSAMYYSRKFNL